MMWCAGDSRKEMQQLRCVRCDLLLLDGDRKIRRLASFIVTVVFVNSKRASFVVFYEVDAWPSQANRTY